MTSSTATLSDPTASVTSPVDVLRGTWVDLGARTDAAPQAKDTAALGHLIALARAAAICATTTATLAGPSGRDVLGAPLAIGLLAGAISAGLQLGNALHLGWLRSQAWLSTTGNDATLLRSWAKNATFFTAYVLTLHVAMVLVDLRPATLGPAVLGGLLASVGLTLYSETMWSLVNARWTHRAIARDPAREARHRRTSDLMAFGQAIVLTAVQVLAISGSTPGVALLAAVGLLGFVLHYALGRERR